MSEVDSARVMEEVAPKVEIDAEFASLIPALSDEKLKDWKRA